MRAAPHSESVCNWHLISEQPRDAYLALADYQSQIHCVLSLACNTKQKVTWPPASGLDRPFPVIAWLTTDFH